ncbi:MAG: HMGL-like, partial [Nitrospira sp.]|nr:HMGL-like [Nitrospira sp.]
MAKHVPNSIRKSPIRRNLATKAVSAPLEIYDTTLRDGAQAEDVTFSADDKV